MVRVEPTGAMTYASPAASARRGTSIVDVLVRGTDNAFYTVPATEARGLPGVSIGAPPGGVTSAPRRGLEFRREDGRLRARRRLRYLATDLDDIVERVDERRAESRHPRLRRPRATPPAGRPGARSAGSPSRLPRRWRRAQTESTSGLAGPVARCSTRCGRRRRAELERKLVRRAAPLVGRKIGVPLAERAEGRPELTLRLLVVQRAVDVRHGERFGRGREALYLARLPVELAPERHAQVVQLLERLVAHYHHDPGLHDGQLLTHARAAGWRRVVRVVHGTLHEHGAVHRERVDAEALEALHERAARTTVERNTLLDLRGHRGELEEHDVRLRVPGSEHGHEVAAWAMLTALDLPGEQIQLTDRSLEVLLANLVVSCRHLVSGF